MVERLTPKEMAQTFSKFVNVMANEKEVEEFVKEVMCEHRTLQQSMFNVVRKLIVEWAGQTNFDGRNEWTVKVCRQLRDNVPDLKYRTPFI